MANSIGFLLLVLVTLAWLSLPFIPALLELLRPRDAAPLAAVGYDAGDLTFFADGFRRYLDEAGLREAFDDAAVGSASATGTLVTDPAKRAIARTSPRFSLGDGTPVRVVRTDAEAELLGESEGKPRTGDRAPKEITELLVINTATRLPNNLAFEREVHARKDLMGGAASVFRALLADHRAVLGEGTTVLRWVHTDEQLIVGADSTLHGRATSGDELLLGPSVRFERLMARRIVVGNTSADVPFDVTAPILVTIPATTPWVPDDADAMAADTSRVVGNLSIPANSYVTGNLVVTGTLKIGKECRIDGSMKSHRSITIGEGCIVSGTIAARGRVTIGEKCRIGGPVIAEREVVVGTHAWVGQPMRPTTITAPVVVLEYGVTVFGVVQAREGGWTEAKA